MITITYTFERRWVWLNINGERYMLTTYSRARALLADIA